MKFSIASFLLITLLSACGSSDPTDDGNGNATDIKDVIFTATSADCADYADEYVAEVQDIQRGQTFTENVDITVSADACTLVSNGIPNHDFNDATASFANITAEVTQTLSIPRNPSLATSTTELSQPRYDAVMLNGVVLDILSAGCYDPNSNMADADGNVPIGCMPNDGWLLDPLGTDDKFGADTHNAHTQPNGLYHYHGNPNAMFNDTPGATGSPVIGFAADGFPIYGSYFVDESGNLRKALSGYTIKSGSRPGPDDNDPGGIYNGIYNDDWEFTAAGDLDECNGMTVNEQYGYYVSDTFPWVIRCFAGTPDASFIR